MLIISRAGPAEIDLLSIKHTTIVPKATTVKKNPKRKFLAFITSPQKKKIEPRHDWMG